MNKIRQPRRTEFWCNVYLNHLGEQWIGGEFKTREGAENIGRFIEDSHIRLVYRIRVRLKSR